MITAITVTYNSARLVGQALNSVLRAATSANVEVELIVVDNASSDDSSAEVASQFPRATLVANARNVGFGAANNQAFKRASGDYWLLLNPDAVIAEGALGGLIAFLDANPDAAGVGPAVESAGAGEAESSGMAPSIRSLIGHFLFLNRLLPGDRGGAFRGVQLHRRTGVAPRPVDWVGAMALLLRPSAVRQVGGFDESIFLYGEDVDLGQRLRAAGWTLWLLPEARATHLVAGSQGGVSTRWIDALHHVYARRAGRLQLVAFDGVLAAGLALRAVAAAVRRPGQRGLHARRMRASARRAADLLTSPANPPLEDLPEVAPPASARPAGRRPRSR